MGPARVYRDLWKIPPPPTMNTQRSRLAGKLSVYILQNLRHRGKLYPVSGDNISPCYRHIASLGSTKHTASLGLSQ